MTHAHDDIRVGTLCLPFIGNGWLMPWGEVVSNPLKAQRLAEEYRERQERLHRKQHASRAKKSMANTDSTFCSP